LNNYLHATLRESFREFLPADADYERVFDRYEYLAGLAYAEFFFSKTGEASGPLGRFWLKMHWPGGANLGASIDKDIEAEGERWPPLVAGLFSSKLLKNLLPVKAAFDQYAASQNPHW
jgi:hypothetical protein